MNFQDEASNLIKAVNSYSNLSREQLVELISAMVEIIYVRGQRDQIEIDKKDTLKIIREIK